MGTEEKPLESDATIIAKLDALQVGLAVLQAVLNLRRGEESEVELEDQGVKLKVSSHAPSNRVIVTEV